MDKHFLHISCIIDVGNMMFFTPTKVVSSCVCSCLVESDYTEFYNKY